MRTYELYEVVVRIHDVPGTALRAGQAGTIVEYLADGAYEVEFTDSFGCTIDSRGFLANELALIASANPSVRRVVSVVPVS